MMGKYVRVRAQIVDLPIFSVHADAIELVDWLARSGRPPEAVFVVHGEPAASAALATRIRSTLDWTAVVPHLMERVQLDR